MGYGSRDLTRAPRSAEAPEIRASRLKDTSKKPAIGWVAEVAIDFATFVHEGLYIFVLSNAHDDLVTFAPALGVVLSDGCALLEACVARRSG